MTLKGIRRSFATAFAVLSCFALSTPDSDTTHRYHQQQPTQQQEQQQQHRSSRVRARAMSIREKSSHGNAVRNDIPKQKQPIQVKASTVKEKLRSFRTAQQRNLLYYNVPLESRIVGGTNAADNEFPSYAFTAGSELCGGSLIHPDIVLTAAHCGITAFTHGVLIGGIRLDGSQSEFIGVEESIPHPNYNNVTEENDIMLIKLESTSTVPLQALTFNASVPAGGASVTVIGYGKTAENGTTSDDLLKVNVTVDATCTSLGPLYNSSIHICAGDPVGSKDACQGDSGGPLFVSSGRQVGIVSSGTGCGRGIPALYTRVSAYQQWIKDTICGVSSVPPANCSRTRQATTSPTSIATAAATSSSLPTITNNTTSSPSTTATASNTVQPVASPSSLAPSSAPVVTTASPTLSLAPTVALSASLSPSSSIGPSTFSPTSSPKFVFPPVLLPPLGLVPVLLPLAPSFLCNNSKGKKSHKKWKKLFSKKKGKGGSFDGLFSLLKSKKGKKGKSKKTFIEEILCDDDSSSSSKFADLFPGFSNIFQNNDEDSASVAEISTESQTEEGPPSYPFETTTTSTASINDLVSSIMDGNNDNAEKLKEMERLDIDSVLLSLNGGNKKEDSAETLQDTNKSEIVTKQVENVSSSNLGSLEAIILETQVIGPPQMINTSTIAEMVETILNGNALLPTVTEARVFVGNGDNSDRDNQPLLFAREARLSRKSDFNKQEFVNRNEAEDECQLFIHLSNSKKIVFKRSSQCKRMDI